MEKIASFQINHTRLMPGMYTSRIDGDVVTYDLRFVRPNTPPFLENGVLHTIEHLFATFVRSSRFKDGIIYFGPMGCRTGFYFLTRGIAPADVIELTKEALAFIGQYEDDIPGASAEECGNYREHDLPGARAAAVRMLEILKTWKESLLTYQA